MKLLTLLLLINVTAMGQTISTFLPTEMDKAGRYLFYLHGGVVTELGNNAINQSVPEWGPYEFLNILDSLRKRGFNVISERRRKGIANSFYVNRLSKQVDSLLIAGVKTSNLIIIGASAGSDIALKVSSTLKNNDLNFVIMGGCWPDTYKEYRDVELYGHFLSIIETTDPHGTCYKIFEGRKQLRSYKEVKLNMGLSHGFIYKGYKEWIDPIMKWRPG